MRQTEGGFKPFGDDQSDQSSDDESDEGGQEEGLQMMMMKNDCNDG